MIQNGHIGQVKGPFPAQIDLLEDNAAIGAFTPELEKPVLYKIGIQAQKGTVISINNTNITIGNTGMYQLDDVVRITEISFPNGADQNTLIDFVYTGRTV